MYLSLKALFCKVKIQNFSYFSIWLFTFFLLNRS